VGTRQVVTLICDLCEYSEGETAGIAARRIVVEGRASEAEVCESCWSTLMAAFAFFATKGRRVPTRTRVKSANGWPGSTWKFTPHALIRCGERDLDPLEIVKAIDDPTVTRPGRSTDLEIRERGYVKAVVAPERGIVITVARKGEDDRILDEKVG
jgi:hypothetical protein